MYTELLYRTICLKSTRFDILTTHHFFRSARRPMRFPRKRAAQFAAKRKHSPICPSPNELEHHVFNQLHAGSRFADMLKAFLIPLHCLTDDIVAAVFLPERKAVGMIDGSFPAVRDFISRMQQFFRHQHIFIRQNRMVKSARPPNTRSCGMLHIHRR